ncbi:MAG: DUF4389 domain-containing protein, partial [Acidimicrobiia bacterium]
MSQVFMDVPYVEPRNRGTTAARIILAVPHLIIASAWQSLIQAIAVIQWFIILFTGKRNKGLFDFSNLWLAYSTRTTGYCGLLFDEYPAFAFTPDGANTPMRYSFTGEETADRLTNGLRVIWAIPALVVMFFVGIGAFFVTIGAWFAIVITGKMPRGMFDFLVRFHRFGANVNAYTQLMTDTYPKY